MSPPTGGTSREDMRRDTLTPGASAQVRRATEEVRSEEERVRGLMRQAITGLPLDVPQLGTAIRMFEPLAMPGMTIELEKPPLPKRLIREPAAPVVLAQLKEKGWRVSVQHLRLIWDRDELTVFTAPMNDWRGIYRDAVILDPMPDAVDELRYELLLKGGKTTVKIQREGIHATSYPEHEGVAICSETDAFCRADGLIIALERALADAGFKWDEVGS